MFAACLIDAVSLYFVLCVSSEHHKLHEAMTPATLEREFCVIFVPADASLPAQNRPGKVRKRYSGLVTYRRELRIPEAGRTICSYESRWNPLFGVDGVHFREDIAAEVMKEIVDDAEADTRRERQLDPGVLVLVIAAGWNAEGTSDKSTSRIEAVAAKLLSECRCVRDLLVLVAGFGRASIVRWQCVAPSQEVLPRPGNTGTRHVTRRFHLVRAKPSFGSIVRQGEAQLGSVPVHDGICFVFRVSFHVIELSIPVCISPYRRPRSCIKPTAEITTECERACSGCWMVERNGNCGWMRTASGC